MNSDEQTELDDLAAAITTITPGDAPSVLLGWIVVAEFSDIDGRRWLAVRSGSAPDSDHFTASWQRRGYLREVLDTGWDDPTANIIDDPDETV